MAIFSVSDIVIAATLLVNALALLSTRIHPSSIANVQNRKMSRLSSFARLAQAVSQKAGILGDKNSELNLIDIESQAEREGLLLSSDQSSSSSSSSSSQSLYNIAAAAAAVAANGDSGIDGGVGGGDGSSQSWTSDGDNAGTSLSQSPHLQLQDSVKIRIQKLLFGVRKYSCVLIFWNVIYFILMSFVFNR